MFLSVTPGTKGAHAAGYLAGVPRTGRQPVSGWVALGSACRRKHGGGVGRVVSQSSRGGYAGSLALLVAAYWGARLTMRHAPRGSGQGSPRWTASSTTSGHRSLSGSTSASSKDTVLVVDGTQRRLVRQEHVCAQPATEAEHHRLPIGTRSTEPVPAAVHEGVRGPPEHPGALRVKLIGAVFGQVRWLCAIRRQPASDISHASLHKNAGVAGCRPRLWRPIGWGGLGGC